ncbi:uncharacterized protein LOC116297774 [Actinia tenebrosa]|uniref:Uncharacterized protein LOC116297774 n=1 Tax=Actinia tenebrosa TaxID=6105 RepID=A0A6P8I9T8_ACTTE|nr:uncharacterized protein LOC116297774 [Actinia tenebrosa]
MRHQICLLWALLFLVSSTVHGWPSISTMLSNYPLYESYSTNQMIDLAGLPTWLYGSNTCAMRVSYAMIKSGYTINISSGQFNWSGVRASRKGNEKYIIRVATWRRYLESKKGLADVVSTSQSSYSGKKGIIVFQDCGFVTATGHVDLYDGSDCKGHCYFSSCNNIRLFEFS